MGVDITIFPEYLFNGSYWTSLCGAFRPERNREIFQLVGLTGCNLLRDPAVDPIFSLRGLPSDLGCDARANAFIDIDGDWRSDYLVSREEAESLISEGRSRWCDDLESSILDPGVRGHTWLLAEEYKSVLLSATEVGDEWWALLALVQEMERRGNHTRLIMWFDD
jgi:hypothetical protein